MDTAMRGAVLTWSEESVMDDMSITNHRCTLTTYDTWVEAVADLGNLLGVVGHALNDPPIHIKMMTRRAPRMGDEDGEVDVRFGVEIRQEVQQ